MSIKELLPHKVVRSVRPWYHGFLASLANIYYGKPSNKLVVIGVTGTNGKTTTANLITKILEEAGYRVGLTSTAVLNITGTNKLNDLKMTMPSGMILQKWLHEMVKIKFQYAVLEVSSEGLAQNRHLGINFDVAVFTNLTPEHLEAHGGFENYKRAKTRLFSSLSKFYLTPQKLKINPKLQKTIITNADDASGEYYAFFKADKKIYYGFNNQATVKGLQPEFSPNGVKFKVNKIEFNLHLKGQFDIYNALAAVATATDLGISLDICKQALEKVNSVPGRVEVLLKHPFTVVVDYAYEPEELRQLYETIDRWPHNNIIQVLGPTGGGRDQARIPILGKMAALKCKLVFITTDDPYNDDPNILAQRMATGAVDTGKKMGQNIIIELDRRQAIARALMSAEPGDIVLITGKGADQKMCLAGYNINWDDRTVVKEELAKLGLFKA